MSIETLPQWQQWALYAVAAAVLLTLLFRIPRIGPALRGIFSLAILAFGLFLILQQAPFDPNLSRLTERLGLDRQEVSGREVRIRMSPDGHFWARARINGVERRLLIDSGATVTALSVESARLAKVDEDTAPVPVGLRTANGLVMARTGSIETLDLGGIEAKNLKVVISPTLGPLDVLGMNFLSQLAAWRVEGRTLILTPKPAAP